MAGLPTDVSICTVVGRLASTEQVANSDDAPDVTPLTGKVVFRASVPHVIHQNTNTIFVPQKIEAVLDSQGNFSAQIVASNDPDLNPYNWTYNVSFQLANAVIAPFNFIALGGVTMEITDIIPVASSTGIPVTAGGTGPQGPPGPAGADGDPGDSAYEIAVQQGFVGDINAWLDSLQGAPGDGADPQDIRDIVANQIEGGTGIDVTSFDPSSLTVRSYYGYRGQWSSSGYYWTGDMVYHNQKFYQALTTGVMNQNPTTNPDDWSELPVNAASGGVTDHGLLTGLGDDDHTQYLNNARGDARYSLLAHNHDARYYTETEVDALIATATGGDPEVIRDTVAAFAVAGTGITVTHNDAANTLTIASTVTSGVTDHGALTGLGDDDHTQYHNDTRGDVRYYTKSQVDTLVGSAGSLQTVDNKTASYTLVAGDIGKLITMSSTSALALNIPTDAAVTWPIGGRVDIIVTNTGMVTVAAVTPGTTAVNGTPSLVSRARYSSFSAIKIAANSWVIVGDLA